MPLLAQTGTTVTGVTKTQGQQTPAQAGLKVLKTVASVSVYGTVRLQACETDSAGRCVRYREVTCGGVTYLGPRLGYVKGDGTWIDEAAAAGIKQVPNSGCSPAGLATEAVLELTPSVAEPTRLPAAKITQVKVLPDQPSVDWSSIAPAAAATPAASKQDQDRGKVLNSEEWTCVAAASVPNAATGAENLFCDSGDADKLKRKNSAGTVNIIEGGGGGSGDITDVGNCATGACFTSATANLVFAGPASGPAAAATMRALVDDDIPNTITASNYQSLDADLTALAAFAGTGFAARTAADAWAQRSFADSARIAWTNPAGVAGNPSADLVANSVTGSYVDESSLLGIPDGALSSNVALLNRVDQTFTARQFISRGATPATALGLLTDALASAGTRDSSYLLFRGHGFDTLDHPVEWLIFNEVTANAGTSRLTFRSAVDPGVYTTRAWLSDAGIWNAVGGFQVNGAALNFSHLAGAASDAQVPDSINLSQNVVTDYQDWTAIAAPATPAVGKGRLYFKTTTKMFCGKDDAGVETCMDAGAGGSTSWSGLTAPTAAVSMTSDATAETVAFDFQAAFTGGSQFLVKSSVGNPTGGTLFELLSHDADVTVFKAGDGTNGISLSAAGSLTALGTGGIVATTGDSATSFFSAGTLEDTRLSANVSLLGQTIATAEIENDAVSRDKVSAVLRTRQIIFVLGAENGAALADADDQPTIFSDRLGSGITITEVWCESDAGSPIINLQRDDGTPANILSANLTCSTTGATGTIDAAEDNVANTERVDFVMVTAGGTAKRVTVAIKFTLD